MNPLLQTEPHINVEKVGHFTKDRLSVNQAEPVSCCDRIPQYGDYHDYTLQDWFHGVWTQIQPLNLHYCLELCCCVMLRWFLMTFCMSETPKRLLKQGPNHYKEKSF